MKNFWKRYIWISLPISAMSFASVILGTADLIGLKTEVFQIVSGVIREWNNLVTIPFNIIPWFSYDALESNVLVLILILGVPSVARLLYNAQTTRKKITNFISISSVVALILLYGISDVGESGGISKWFIAFYGLILYGVVFAFERRRAIVLALIVLTIFSIEIIRFAPGILKGPANAIIEYLDSLSNEE